MRIASHPWLLAISMLALVPGLAAAQQSDVPVLLARIEQLEQTIALLERRIAALESSGAPPTGQARTTATGNWREIANWRQLERRMTMDQVRALLGEPGRVDATPFMITWYWGNRDGEVLFDADSRRVEGWSEPSR